MNNQLTMFCAFGTHQNYLDWHISQFFMLLVLDYIEITLIDKPTTFFMLIRQNYPNYVENNSLLL